MNKSSAVKFNEKTKENHIKSSYLYVFDQVLTLYRYTIKQVHDGDRKSLNAFTQRLRFMGAIKKRFSAVSDTSSEDFDKLQKISKWLDSGVAALDIVDIVKHDDVFSQLDCNGLTSVIENEAIIFAKSNKIHPYSFSAMHAALKDPITIFQNFLKLPSPTKIVNIAIAHYLLPYKSLYEENRQCFEFVKSVKRNVYRLGSDVDSNFISVRARTAKVIRSYPCKLGFRHQPRRNPFYHQSVKVPPLSLERARQIEHRCPFRLEDMTQEYGDGKYALKKDDLSMHIEDAIDEFLENWAVQVFKSITPRSVDVTKLFSDFLDTSELENTAQLTVNPEKLELLCLLGQSNNIGELIAKKIKANYVKDEQLKDSLLNKEADCLAKLSRWFKGAQSGYIKRVDQIPAHIASILYWRVFESSFVHYITFSDGEAIEISSRKTVEQCQKTVTAVIKSFLYHDNANSSLLIKHYPGEPTLDNLVGSVDKYIEHLANLTTECKLNTLMKEWTEFESEKTRNRFKRPLQDFWKSFDIVDKKVEAQQQNSLNHPFPLHFSVPLWLKV